MDLLPDRLPYPDVVGRELTEARELLDAAGWDIAAVIRTLPPRVQDEDYGGPVRVVRLCQAGEYRVSVTVVRDDQGKRL